MKQMTEQHLINAFGGESQAHMRYLHFVDQADKENYSNTARLFRSIAHAEYVHAGDHYRELKHLEGGFVANSMAAFGNAQRFCKFRQSPTELAPATIVKFLCI